MDEQQACQPHEVVPSEICTICRRDNALKNSVKGNVSLNPERQPTLVSTRLKYRTLSTKSKKFYPAR